jgi:hypothetical protein
VGEAGEDLLAPPVAAITLLAAQLAGHQLAGDPVGHDGGARIRSQIVVPGRVLWPAEVGGDQDHGIAIGEAEDGQCAGQTGPRAGRGQHRDLNAREP